MKTFHLESILNSMGYRIVRANKHEVWSNGVKTVIIPRQRTIARPMAKSILKQIEYPTPVHELNYRGIAA